MLPHADLSTSPLPLLSSALCPLPESSALCPQLSPIPSAPELIWLSGRALLSFKAAADPQGKALSSWNARLRPNYCTWTGVTCASTGRVVSLYVASACVRKLPVGDKAETGAEICVALTWTELCSCALSEKCHPYHCCCVKQQPYLLVMLRLSARLLFYCRQAATSGPLCMYDALRLSAPALPSCPAGSWGGNS